MDIKIVTDSACDISEEILASYDIDLMPLNVLDGEIEYLDKKTISPQEIYGGMREGRLYQTSQVSPKIMWQNFEKYARMDRNIIYICFSSGLSGQFQTANLIYEEMKQEYPNFKMDIIDSKAASVGMGLMVKKAGQMAKDSRTRDEILAMLEFYIANMMHIIMVDKMDYLYKGGRISKIQALAGGILNVKPVLSIDGNGRLEYLDKLRGRKKLFKKVDELMQEAGNLDQQSIGLVYGDNKGLALEFESMINQAFKPKNLMIENIGASVSAHTGPDMIGITYLKKIYKD